MIRFMTTTLLVIASLAVALLATAQDADTASAKSKNKTLKYADPEKKAARGTQVVANPKQATPVKEWPLNATGSSAMGVTVYVRKVVLYSDGMARFHLSFWNRGRETQTIYFDFDRTFVADEESNPLDHIGQQYQNINGISRPFTITADSRFDFHQDYRAPVSPAAKLKVGILLQGRYDHNADAFKSFLINFQEPLFFDNGVFEEKKAAAVPSLTTGNFGGGREGNGEVVGPAGPMGGEAIHVCPSPKQFEEREQKFRALSEGGLRIDGNLFLAQGRDQYAGRILFKQRDRGDFVEATMVTLTGTPRTFELHGAFFDDPRSETGLALKLRDNAKVIYTFKLDGNSLSATDTLGNRFNFLLRAR